MAIVTGSLALRNRQMQSRILASPTTIGIRPSISSGLKLYTLIPLMSLPSCSK
jgi:hypothetical protein